MLFGSYVSVTSSVVLILGVHIRVPFLWYKSYSNGQCYSEWMLHFGGTLRRWPWLRNAHTVFQTLFPKLLWSVIHQTLLSPRQHHRVNSTCNSGNELISPAVARCTPTYDHWQLSKYQCTLPSPTMPSSHRGQRKRILERHNRESSIWTTHLHSKCGWAILRDQTKHRNCTDVHVTINQKHCIDRYPAAVTNN